MKNRFIALLWIFTVLALPSLLNAHPMGNFSINHYAAISATAGGPRICYLIDMAEIPTFQEMSSLDPNKDNEISNSEAAAYAVRKSAEFCRNLRLVINNKTISLHPVQSSIRIVPGAGGLPTLVITSLYGAGWAGLQHVNSMEYTDRNFPERLGWKEIVVDTSSSDVFRGPAGLYVDRSNALTQYPADPTLSSPQETHAEFTFDQQALAKLEEPVSLSAVPRVTLPLRDDRFTRLISSTEFNGKILLFSMVIAFALGALHALSPGHGKTIVAGYLVGSRGTALHAVFLGAVVTFTHTIGVFALGLITLYGSRYILPEQLYPWLGFLSGISIVIIGVTSFQKRYRATKHSHHHDQHQHHHHDDNDHHHSHGHSHMPVDAASGAITWKSLLTIGISGGALPCPSALVVLLSAISLHRTGFGLLLIVAFSIGLALVLTGIGLVLVYASQLTRRLPAGSAVLVRLPLVSSIVISVLGFAIALRSIL
jgi:ABC-type nickel/cobalt efflux system permease component RcnA